MLPFYRDYNPDHPWEVTAEPQTIDDDGQICLMYIPLKGVGDQAVSILGYTETTSKTPSESEFYIDYKELSAYKAAKGIVQFHLSKAGQSVLVDYYGVSTRIRDKDLNQVGDHLANEEMHVTPAEKDFWNSKQDAQQALAVMVGPVTVGEPGSDPSVINVGDMYLANLAFTLPGSPLVRIGSVSIVDAGEDPSVTNLGTEFMANLAFNFPSSPTLHFGEVVVGNAGTMPFFRNFGDEWHPNLSFTLPQATFVEIGNTFIGNADINPFVTNFGNDNHANLAFTFPQPVKFSIGPTSTGEAGTPASVVNVGDVNHANLAFTIPQGNAATIALGTFSTGAPNTSVIMNNSGTAGAAVFNFIIPRGTAWLLGSGVPDNSVGMDGDLYTNGTTGDVYRKVAGVWGNTEANLKGPAGSILGNATHDNDILFGNTAGGNWWGQAPAGWNESLTLGTHLAGLSFADASPPTPNDSLIVGFGKMWNAAAGAIPKGSFTAPNDFIVGSGVGTFAKKTAAEVQTILGLGNAAYHSMSEFATSPGNLVSAAFNTMVTPGWYLMNSGQTNAPEATDKYWLEVISQAGTTTYVLQRATRYTSNVVYQRINNNNVWTAWGQVYPAVYS